MQFKYDGKNYRISFERQHRDINVIRDGRVKSIKSKYPFTTVKITEHVLGEPGKIIYRATVGCLPTDVYSKRAGALSAMRELSQQLSRAKHPEAFRTAMWEAYNSRTNPPALKVTVSNEQKLLPEPTEAPEVPIRNKAS